MATAAALRGEHESGTPRLAGDAARASVQARLRDVELRVARSPAPWSDDLVALASLGAAVTEVGPRGSRWLQRVRAQALMDDMQGRMRRAGSARPEDFIKLVLAASAASRGQPHDPRDVLCARYQALVDLVDDSARPSVELLMQLAKAGAQWAQAVPLQSPYQLREQLLAVRLRLLALRVPRADDYIRLTVLEVAMLAAERRDDET